MEVKPVLKTGGGQPSVSSNLTASASLTSEELRKYSISSVMRTIRCRRRQPNHPDMSAQRRAGRTEGAPKMAESCQNPGTKEARAATPTGPARETDDTDGTPTRYATPNFPIRESTDSGRGLDPGFVLGVLTMHQRKHSLRRNLIDQHALAVVNLHHRSTRGFLEFDVRVGRG